MNQSAPFGNREGWDRMGLNWKSACLAQSLHFDTLHPTENPAGAALGRQRQEGSRLHREFKDSLSYRRLFLKTEQKESKVPMAQVCDSRTVKAGGRGSQVGQQNKEKHRLSFEVK